MVIGSSVRLLSRELKRRHTGSRSIPVLGSLSGQTPADNGRWLLACRKMGTGPRGQRGHGWYVNYRAGKGGRHLQGEYSDRPSLEEQQRWNEAILSLGSVRVSMSVVVEPKRSENNTKGSSYPLPETGNLKGEAYGLEMVLASSALEKTTLNFTELLGQLVGTRIYRFEKNVGICGGDYLTNTGRSGQASQGDPLLMDVSTDPLALWHLPGTVTMIVPKVGSVDSRFMLLSQAAPHMDGIHRAFGTMTSESVEQIRTWQKEILTRNGVPTSFDLIITDASVIEDGSTRRQTLTAEEQSEEVV